MRVLLCAGCIFLLAACGTEADRTAAIPAPTATSPVIPSSSSGLWPFGSSDSDAAVAGPQLGVNGYLWRATLDTLNFMPLTAADPVGGVVITDWYAQPENPAEHVKVTAYILDRRLRADALRVTVFRQVRGASGWVDAPVNPDTGTKLENAILDRARELRLASVQAEQ